MLESSNIKMALFPTKTKNIVLLLMLKLSHIKMILLSNKSKEQGVFIFILKSSHIRMISISHKIKDYGRIVYAKIKSYEHGLISYKIKDILMFRANVRPD